MSLQTDCVVECNSGGISDSCIVHNCKRRRVFKSSDTPSNEIMREIEASLPILQSPGYYTKPSLKELATQEFLDPGYCSRVPDFTVGRFGYGSVRYLKKTDVRGLNLDEIVKFHRHEIVVYVDENDKPEVGQGLNKAAEVVLILDNRILKSMEWQEDVLVKKLKQSTKRQGAKFISFDLTTGEWKFLVEHFSRFGFGEDDEEDIIMDDAEMYDVDKESPTNTSEIELSHSLPAHLRLDPVKMRGMRLLMFPDEEAAEELSHKSSLNKEHVRPLHNSSQAMTHRSSPPVARKTPFALLDYKHGSFDSNSPGSILMVQQHKGMPIKTIKAEGFKLDLKHETPVSGNYACNIVDAGLFMGKSFRVGWGPNGILVHSGAPVGSGSDHKLLSSVVNLEKVAFDKLVRDENNKVKEELVDYALVSPLYYHKGLNHLMKEVKIGPCKLTLQKLEANRTTLSEISHGYCDIIEKQLTVPGLSSSTHLGLTNQVMAWELIRVLFSDREQKGQVELGADNEEDMMQDIKEVCQDVDQEALPLMRRAEFSYWLRESVSYHVQNQISSLNDSDYLQHIFVLLTGRQLDEAVQLAVSKGDVRLGCLLSQAGGSTSNRSDIARQLDIWRTNGLDFSFIENNRLRLYELLAGNIHDALHDVKLDWRRFLGLLMWYELPPDTSLPVAFQTYKHYLDEGRAPYPVPLFIDEGPSEEAINWNSDEHFDISFYLMLLHASEETEFSFLKAMFSAFSSTPDPLDYHMIWHQRAVLEAVGVINSNDLHILDMGFVSQLLCLGKCHWAIYVILHMPFREDYPYLHLNLIREILFQYCETWSSDESQHQFIENLGIPTEWMHEAMATYYNYNGDLSKALEHFLQCANWQKAHTIFITSVAYRFFLLAKHTEIWRIATSMESHKSEIENWELGAGIYISFYLMRNSLQGDSNAMTELDSLPSKNAACRDFVSQLNESLAVWGCRLPVDARLVYSKMASEICDLLLSAVGEGATRDEQFSCFDTAFAAPISEDLRSSHLQDAAYLFTSFLSEIAT